MKIPFLLLAPFAALFFSACAGPGGPAYVDYGPGPDPRAGYYWNGSVYIQGENPYYHHDGQYNRSVTDVNDVNINRTNVNDRTVNRTNVSNSRVNSRTVNQRNQNVKRSVTQTHQNKKTQKPHPEDKGNQQGNQ